MNQRFLNGVKIFLYNLINILKKLLFKGEV